METNGPSKHGVRVSVRLTPRDEERLAMLQTAGLPDGCEPRTRAAVIRRALHFYALKVEKEVSDARDISDARGRASEG